MLDSQASQEEYQRRIHRVLEYIDQRLDQPLGLHTLSHVAHFSPFHFHRLFFAWMGETIGGYVTRRRVETAAMRLAAQPRLQIIQVSLSVGFNSPEAFSRAFKVRFGCSPSLWRDRESLRHRGKSKLSQVKSRVSQETGKPLAYAFPMKTSNQTKEIKVSVVERSPTVIAYLRHHGPYGKPISLVWQNTVYPWMVANDLLACPRYGISHDDPEVTDPEKCRYDAGVDVPNDFVPSVGSVKTTIPGCKSAVLKFKGTVAEIGASWSALLRDWLPSSGLQLDARPAFEYYPRGSSYDPKTGVFDCEICIPIAPL